VDRPRPAKPCGCIKGVVELQTGPGETFERVPVLRLRRRKIETGKTSIFAVSIGSLQIIGSVLEP
jgi:hypothetical protein